ncbi:hypothetical protein A9Q99_10415 [Gammaproteobacteria bacterium 45_16_T64]|nr:hypothetical protein A9Q99_10415 [Gammaproteobacteria bacterium 45_16_T64]
MKYTLLCLAGIMCLGLTACGGGGSSGDGSGDSSGGAGLDTVSITGGVIDGPIAYANIAVHHFTAGAIGEQVGTAGTDANGAITGLNVVADDAPFILIATTDGDSIDVTTGIAPVISELKTILMSVNDTPIYATPLTSIASDIALANSDASTDAAELAALLEQAADQTVAALGFGLDSSVDIFTTPPVITANTRVDDLSDIAAYRAAIEALVDAVESASDNTAGQSNVVNENAVLTALAKDLVDGQIDGQESATAIENLANTNIAVEVEETPTVDEAAIIELLEQDAEVTGVVNTVVIDEIDGIDGVDITIVIVGGTTTPDSDGDSVSDINDNCVHHSNTNQLNFDQADGDNAGDVCDSDDDNDGVADSADSCATEDFDLSSDIDSDGCDDANEDADDDNDGVLDTAPDNCPTVENADQDNLDGDSLGDACDDDRDGDGSPNSIDSCPDDATDTCAVPAEGVYGTSSWDDGSTWQ